MNPALAQLVASLLSKAFQGGLTTMYARPAQALPLDFSAAARGEDDSEREYMTYRDERGLGQTNLGRMLLPADATAFDRLERHLLGAPTVRPGDRRGAGLGHPHPGRPRPRGGLAGHVRPSGGGGAAEREQPLLRAQEPRPARPANVRGAQPGAEERVVSALSEGRSRLGGP